ncbi:MAG TPA: FAD-binding oxidoreductase [Egibacteraceae bacterium]|nr:FAD-binding oxidoreductase [Egibacteraceae bacterium]
MDLHARLAAVVGATHVLADAGLRAPYETDWTGRFSGRASLVVRPANTREVAGVIRACADAGVAVVPQGGNTGLVGGGVPRGGEVVVSLARLTALEPVDAAARAVVAGAGATLARLQAHAAEADLAFPVDLAARETATVGGLVATNAGGVHVLRYGAMRAQVLGVEAVLADGRVLSHLSGLAKDNTGYHLPSLLTGSEGTLAVITRACLRLVPALPARVTALLGLASTADALTVLARLRADLPSLEAAEICYADGIALVAAHTGLALPLRGHHPCYLLVECAAPRDPTDALAEALAHAPEVADAAVATDRAGRAGLWAFRERHTEAVAALGVGVKLDVTLRPGAVAAFEEAVRRQVAGVAPGARTLVWGHLGDGNLHVTVVGPEPGDEAVEDAVLGLVAEAGGSISAEHGIGVAKTRWLPRTRSAVDLAVMRAVKQALDPAGLLNPGVLFARVPSTTGEGLPAAGDVE